MKKISNTELKKLNEKFRKAKPEEIIQWAIDEASSPLVTTNFRPYESAILYACNLVQSQINIIWCDTGYNTPQTYKHAKELIDSLNLNISLYTPIETAAYRDAVNGGIPSVDSSFHTEFTRQVKLEPFQRAMEEHKPDVWFTNLRKGQTAFRDSIEILSYSKNGILKVSPFYHFSDKDLDEYLKERELPNEFRYFDPTKVLDNRECGLHA